MKRKHVRLISILMSIALVFFMFGCQGDTATETETEATYNAGKYTGVGQGIHGDITVEVEVDSDKIVHVNVLEHTETEGISDPAIEQVPQRIVDGQTLAVDVISGATLTS